MKLFAPLVLSFLLCSCAVHKAPQRTIPAVTAPSIVKVASPVHSAKERVTVIQTKVVDPAIVKDLEEVKTDLSAAEKSIGELKTDIDKQTEWLNTTIQEKNRAIEQISYWQEKHQKALRELWMWRSVAMAVAAIIGLFILLKLGIIGGKLLV